MNRTALASAVALAMALPLTVHAGATGSAQISNFHYEVIDLDLNDGITAALTLADSSTLVMAAYNPLNGNLPDPIDALEHEGTAQITSAHGTAQSTYGNGVANVTSSFSGTKGQVFGVFGLNYDFTLTANTKLVLYADGAASGTFGDPDYSTSHAALFADYYATANATETTELRDFVLSSLGNTDARQLTLTITAGADEVSGQLGLSAASYASVSAVPEPSQVALLTVGFAGLAWRLRRAKGKAA
jgi:hypothetical protein